MKLPRKRISQPNPPAKATVIAKPSPTPRRQWTPKDGSPIFWETYVTVFIRHGFGTGFWEALMIDRHSNKITRALVTVPDGGLAGPNKRRRLTKPEDLPF